MDSCSRDCVTLEQRRLAGTLAHTGAGWWVLQIRTDLSGKPAHTPTAIHWQNPAIGATTLPADQRITRVLVHTNQNDTPKITATTEVFHSDGDARALGIAVTAIQLQPLGTPLRPTLLLAFLIVSLFGRWIIQHRIHAIVPFVTGMLWVYFPTWIALHSELLIALSSRGLGGRGDMGLGSKILALRCSNAGTDCSRNDLGTTSSVMESIYPLIRHCHACTHAQSSPQWTIVVYRSTPLRSQCLYQSLSTTHLSFDSPTCAYKSQWNLSTSRF
jgi:hypothetical protein